MTTRRRVNALTLSTSNLFELRNRHNVCVTMYASQSMPFKSQDLSDLRLFLFVTETAQNIPFRYPRGEIVIVTLHTVYIIVHLLEGKIEPLATELTLFCMTLRNAVTCLSFCMLSGLVNKSAS